MSLVQLDYQDTVAVLTLSRPDALNALGLEGDGAELMEVCATLNRNPLVRCVVLTGAGRAFSAGGDIKAMQARTGAFSGSGMAIRESYRTNIHGIVNGVYGLEMPVVAAVNGAAIGLGCDIACMADVRIASDQARFGATFLKLGLVPGDGGAWLLPRTIGMSRASELLFTADVIDAQTAEKWGLVSRVVAHDDLMAEAMALAGRIAAQPPQALRMAKMLLRHGQTASYATLMELSAAAQALSHQTADHMEGVSAVIDRRDARFTGQ
ncbi:MAG: enoyl-CoA hydratase [Alphaproteobacteria bacterium]|uniref:crotonase/enoyl-CoA hydratase family protein n=1 Tax=Brevundimonas sp. BAL3 TaxID=391600 RepID=UPI00017EBB06|nr:crotonase/enoyl-CoA hydratase family protein [Brevundimonas sp. BAL3]EDX81823.1 enoyl-CoA hydratase/isomerase family protein [Brevundimonas sp. BAL3]PZO09075.1 MAG: enoyl-CoA hydratase [Alphaproteobacteria bacterium]